MLHCPHCLFTIVDPDLPSDIKIVPGMICPVCYRDMSLPPRVRVTGAQTFARYVASIAAGGTFGCIATSMVMSLFGFTWDLLWFLPSIVLMFVIGSQLGKRLERTRSHAVRWLILGLPMLASATVWALAYFSLL